MEGKLYIMEINKEQPDKCRCRGRRLTDKLHECTLEHMACRYRLSFGNGYYCSTLMVDELTDVNQRMETASYGTSPRTT
jgi:hypothetical protein